MFVFVYQAGAYLHNDPIFNITSMSKPYNLGFFY